MASYRQPLEACLSSAASGCGGSGNIVAALAAFGASERDRIEQTAARVDSCVSGAAEAVAAYVQADQLMAAGTAAAKARSSNVTNGSLWAWPSTEEVSG